MRKLISFAIISLAVTMHIVHVPVVAISSVDVALSVDQKTVRIDAENKNILFTTSPIDDYEGVSVSLIDTQTGEKVADLYDDGGFEVPDDGDVYMDDGCYSNYLSLSGKELGDYSYHVTFTNSNGDICKTDNVTIHIYEGFTEQELTDMETVDNGSDNVLNRVGFWDLDMESRIAAVEIVLAEFQNNGLVSSYNVNTYQIEYTYSCGVLGVVNLADTTGIDGVTSSASFSYINHDTYIEITGIADSVNDVVIPKEIEGLPVTEIGGGAFLYASITSVVIPETVTTIGQMAFLGCSSLVSVDIPASVDAISSDAFTDCNNLESFIVSEENTMFSSINGVLYDKNQQILIQYPAGKKDTTYTVPSGTIIISKGAFYNNANLENVTIANTVQSLGETAFSYCTNLKKVILFEGIDTIPATAFDACSSLIEVYIPKNVMTIETIAFRGCENLRNIYYSGSEEEWNNISIGANNDALTTATIHYEYKVSTVMMGDCNLDGNFSVADVVMLQKWLLCAGDLVCWQNADFCADGKIDAFDLCLMKRNLMKI